MGGSLDLLVQSLMVDELGSGWNEALEDWSPSGDSWVDRGIEGRPGLLDGRPILCIVMGQNCMFWNVSPVRGSSDSWSPGRKSLRIGRVRDGAGAVSLPTWRCVRWARWLVQDQFVLG
jgi:hypothetical protein